MAKEAYLTAKYMGNHVTSIFDVGVAGIHRLFAHKEPLLEASVLVVVAGMECALPSVVAGMVQNPVIAVPTSIGYGANLGGPGRCPSNQERVPSDRQWTGLYRRPSAG